MDNRKILIKRCNVIFINKKESIYSENGGRLKENMLVLLYCGVHLGWFGSIREWLLQISIKLF